MARSNPSQWIMCPRFCFAQKTNIQFWKRRHCKRNCHFSKCVRVNAEFFVKKVKPWLPRGNKITHRFDTFVNKMCRVTTKTLKQNNWTFYKIFVFIFLFVQQSGWHVGSVARALDWKSKGWGFKSCQVHKKNLVFPSPKVVLTRCRCAQPLCVYARIRMTTYAC